MTDKNALDCLPPGVKAWTRDTYRAAGFPDLPYDPVRPLQAFSSNAPIPAGYDYLGIGPNGPSVLKSNKAASMFPNFRGRPLLLTLADWTKRQPISRSTVTLEAFSKTVKLGEASVFAKADVDRVMSEIHATPGGESAVAVESNDYNGSPATFNYLDDRRYYRVDFKGDQHYFPQIWEWRSQGGVWAPGRWVLADGNIRFIGEPGDDGTGAHDDLPWPFIGLAPDEELAIATASGMTSIVVRKKGAPASSPTGGSGGGFTDADRQLLKDVLAGVRLLNEGR